MSEKCKRWSWTLTIFENVTPPYVSTTESPAWRLMLDFWPGCVQSVKQSWWLIFQRWHLLCLSTCKRLLWMIGKRVIKSLTLFTPDSCYVAVYPFSIQTFWCAQHWHVFHDFNYFEIECVQHVVQVEGQPLIAASQKLCCVERTDGRYPQNLQK